MTGINILSKSEIDEFERPPNLAEYDWVRIIKEIESTSQHYNGIRTRAFKVSYILQYVCVQSSCRFYSLSQILEQDVELLCSHFNTSRTTFELEIQGSPHFARQREQILEDLGQHPFKGFESKVETEIEFFISKRMKPKRIFQQVISFLESRRVERPSYDKLQKLITQGLNKFEREIALDINKHIADEQREALDSLLTEQVDESEHFKGGIKATVLAKLKSPSQSISASSIAKSIQDFEPVSAIYQVQLPLLEKLNLSQEVIAYHASWTTKARYFQIQQFASDEKRYLHLLSFVCHQYKLRQDNFVEVFLRVVRSHHNYLAARKNEEVAKSAIKKDTLNKLSVSRNHYKSFCDKIIQIVNSQQRPEFQLDQIRSIADKETDRKKLREEELDRIQEQMDARLSDDQIYYSLVQRHHKRLLGRIGHLIKYLEFQADTTDPQLLSVIKYYAENNGDLSNLEDLAFLDQIEQEFVLDNKGNVKNSMCKVLLMFKIEKAIKAGVLNLKHSYKYLSYEQYLFDKTEWKQNKSELVQKAGLEHLLDIEPILSELKVKLNEQYHTTNSHLESNPHLKVSRDNKVVVRTPPQPESSSEQIISDLLPDQRFYLLQDVLYNINKSVNFTSQFEHYSIKHHKAKPDDNTFLAVIMALGCNIGIKKMGRISKGISPDTLENTKTWYFTPENLNQANNEIIGAINQLDLPQLYLTRQGQVHTSSDGQKFLVKPESLNSNYSFKYFGKDRGVSIYTFIDQRSSIFYSTVINSASRESTFVLDGLLNDSEVRSTMHSTDTHGYTEVIFGMMNLLDIEFAPRIKNLGKQSLYSFEKRAEYEDQGLSILPDFYIKTDIITQNWDDLLRLLASIKLQKCAASEVLSRLNSYSKQNPLYRAIKEFGRIEKSLFILRYYDDVNLRQSIEKQLNLVEMAHRFAKFIFFDNGQEFDAATKEQQDIIAGCKQLIQNSIILWNYLKLTQLYEGMESEQEQLSLVRAVQNSSIMSWSHINTNGEYVFNEKRAAGGSLDLEKLKGVKIHKANSAFEQST